MKIEVNVTNKELNTLEDRIFCINVCDKHKMIIDTRIDEEKIRTTCKKCQKIDRKMIKTLWRLWHKLVVAYDKADNSSELSEQTKKDIKKSIKEIEKGECYTLEEVKREIYQARADFKAGKCTSWEQVKEENGL